MTDSPSGKTVSHYVCTVCMHSATLGPEVRLVMMCDVAPTVWLESPLSALKAEKISHRGSNPGILQKALFLGCGGPSPDSSKTPCSETTHAHRRSDKDPGPL
jgi:hypothetical protein